jgi:hypothetical protein
LPHEASERVVCSQLRRRAPKQFGAGMRYFASCATVPLLFSCIPHVTHGFGNDVNHINITNKTGISDEKFMVFVWLAVQFLESRNMGCIKSEPLS